jgi:hypothetical protein
VRFWKSRCGGVLLCVLTLFALWACKQTESILSDAATKTSFKTGLFKPRSKSEIILVGKHSPMAVKDFLDLANHLVGKGGLKLLFDEKITYGTTVNGKGHQLLVAVSKNALPLPVLSIEDGKLYSWNQSVVIDRRNATIGINELFLKVPYGRSLEPYDVDQMYIRRSAQNDRGQFEPVLVPWLQHVKSETHDVVTYQVGNSVFEARHGLPLLEFRQHVENQQPKPIWFVLGRYSDQDIRGGAVFWRAKTDVYYSLKKGDQKVVEWRSQDEDSIDRVARISKDKVEIPGTVLKFLEGLPEDLNDKNHPRNAELLGFDSWWGDHSVFQLDRNSLTIVETLNTSAQGLSLSEVGGFAEEVLTDEDYRPAADLGLALANPFDRTKPVVVRPRMDGSQLDAAVYTDQNGKQRGGTVLSSKNVRVPGGYFSNDRYEQRYFVHNATSNTVAEVSATGHVIKDNIPVDEFKNRQKTLVNVDKMQRDGGVDRRVSAESNSLEGRSRRQLEISESYLQGKTTGDMARRVGKTLAIGQVREQLEFALKDENSKALGILVGEQLQTTQLEETHGFQDVGQVFVRGAQSAVVEKVASSIVDPVAQTVWKGTDLSATASKKVGIGSGVGLKASRDMYFKYQDLKEQGVFDPTSPDAAFNRAVGTVRIAGAGAARVAGFVATGDPLAKKTAGKAAVNRLVRDSTGALLDESAAISHGVQAQTLERQRRHILEGSAQRRRDAQAADTALNALNRLETAQGGMSTTKPSTPRRTSGAD